MNDPSSRVRMPADVDAPDRVIYGLTFRQLAILSIAAVVGYMAWNAAHSFVPLPLLAAGGVVLGAVAVALAIGRRDGLPLDLWLLSAVRHRRSPRSLTTLDSGAGQIPDWVFVPKPRVALPAPLRLPADAIDDDGQIQLAGRSSAIAAAGSVNLALRTDDEQQALIGAFGNWLNSLATPTQIVVSAQPVDLDSHAVVLAEQADLLAHPALRQAASDHAAFLADLARRRDPLRRQILVTTAPASGAGSHAARRHAEDTARALAGLGVTARALDGPAVTAALAAAADPYQPPRPGGRAAPDTAITTRSRKRKTHT